MLLLLFTMACTPEQGATNQAPSAIITSHDDAEVVIGGESFRVGGFATDEDSSVLELRATWLVDGQVACSDLTPEADGATACEVTVFEGEPVLTLRVTDPAGAAATDDVTLKVRQSGRPEVEILRPEQGGRYYADEVVTLEGIATDGEEDPTLLLTWWESDLDGRIGQELAPDGEGRVETGAYLGQGTHTVTFYAEDRSGYTDSATVTFDVQPTNSPPECAVTAPADGSFGPDGTRVTFRGTYSDANQDVATLSATWRSDRDGFLQGVTGDADGEVQLIVDDLTPGPHVVSLEVVDDEGFPCVASVRYDVITPPTVEILAPSAHEVLPEGDVAFAARVTDLDDPVEALQLAWEDDALGLFSTVGADAKGLAEVIAAGFTPGARVLTVTVTDSHGLSASASLTWTLNSLPTAPGVVLTPTPPLTSDDLVVTLSPASADAEGDPVTYTYAWTVDGAPASVTGSRVSAADTSKHEVWEVTVTPADPYGSGPAGTASVEVLNTPPIMVGVTINPSAPTTLTDLTCVPTSTDADADAVSYLHTWTVDGVAVVGSGPTLSASNFTRDQAVSCAVTPDDGEDPGSAMAAAVIVLNSAPVVTGVTLSPDPPGTEDTITATVTTADDDGDPVTVEATWYVDGWPVSGVSGVTLAGSYFVRGQVVEVELTPDDGDLTGAPVLSGAVTVENTAPEITSLALEPDPPSTDDSLAASATTADPDGDTVTLSWAWEVNGVAAGTGSTLDASLFEKGDTVRVTGTPSDGTSAGTPVSREVLVDNTPPVVTSVTLTPTDVTTDGTLIASALVDDADGDATTVTWSWAVDGVALSTTTSSLSGTSFDRGESVTVTATASDGTDTGAPVTSSAVVVQDSPPTVTAVSVTPAAPTSETTLEAVAATADPDGDTVSVTWTWTVNGVDSGATGQSLAPSWFVRGDTVVATATPHDGTLAGSPVAGSGVVIGNSPPAAPSLMLTPATPVHGESLWCGEAASSADADGDPTALEVAWTVDGTPFLGATSTTVTGDTVPVGETRAGELWTCVARLHDGYDEGADASVAVEVGSALLDLSSAASGAQLSSAASGALLGATPGPADGGWLVGSPGSGEVVLVTGSVTGAVAPGDAGTVVVSGRTAGDRAGASALGSQDLDGDGTADLLAGAPNDSTGGTSAGVVELLLGPVTGGTLADSDARFIGVGGEGVGEAVLVADLDGDSAWELVTVAAAGGGTLRLADGVTGGDVDLGLVTALVADSAADGLGASVAAADLDGDGADDLVVGAPGVGLAAIWFGAPSAGTLADADVVLGSGASSAGRSVVLADLDGDALDDVVVGAPDDAVVLAFFGVPMADRAGTDADARLDGPTGLGAALAAADFDADGAPDVAVGAPDDDMVVVWLAPSVGTTDADLAGGLLLGASSEGAGSALGLPGDVDGDGLPDLLVGVPGASVGGSVSLFGAWGW